MVVSLNRPDTVRPPVVNSARQPESPVTLPRFQGRVTEDTLTFGANRYRTLMTGAILAAAAAMTNSTGPESQKADGMQNSPTAVEQPIWQKIRKAVREGQDPFNVTTQEERNRIACADDGIRPEQPTVLSAASLADYMTKRTTLIRIKSDPAVEFSDMLPASFHDDIAKGSGWICVSTPHQTEIGTNLHVVMDAHKIVVEMDDGEQYEAEVIGKDSKRDLAYLRLLNKKGRVFPTVHFTPDSNKIKKGDYVATLGNPLDQAFTFSDGRISFVNRPGNSSGQGEIEQLVPNLQITAPITHGSSGGPAHNHQGDFIGMTTSIIANNAGNLAYAVAGNPIADGLLGIRLQQKFGLPTTHLEIGLATDTVEPDRYHEYLDSIRQRIPLIRDELAYIGNELKNLAENPDKMELPPKYLDFLMTKVEGFRDKPRKERLRLYKELLETDQSIRNGDLSLLQAALTSAQASLTDLGRHRAPGTKKGVVVKAVTPGGLAHQAGIPQGAIITAIDGKPVSSSNITPLINSHYSWQDLEVTYDFERKSHTAIVNADGVKKALNEAGTTSQ